MGKSKGKKNIHVSVNRKTQTGLAKRKPVLMFIFFFAFNMALFYVVWLSGYFNANIHPRISSMYAHLSSILLNFLNQGTSAIQDTVNSAAFTIRINRGCDAVEAMALFASAVLAFPAAGKKKFFGLVKGLAFLFVLNLIRIASLFLTGRYYPEYFDFIHVEIWQILFIIFSLGLWMFWAKSQTEKKPVLEK